VLFQLRAASADESGMDDAILTAAFCRWVRQGMPEAAPSFDGLRDSLYFVPADVIEILTRERGLKEFWNYGQAVKQLAGQHPDQETRDALVQHMGSMSTPNG
jgi:hypothetical protein